MELFDTHCHLDFADFDADRSAILARCRKRGINRLLIPGIAANSWQRLLALCAKDQRLYPALGLHPLYVADHRREDLEQLAELLSDPAIVAVGEIGLDYYAEELDRDQQRFFFEAQLMLALKHRRPVVVHVRKAHDEVIRMLKSTGVASGIIHAFNGSLEQGKQYIDLGFKLGFGGMLTYERSTKLRWLATTLPLEALVLETDAPDMTVAAHRGERNSPEYLPDCLQALATIRGRSPEEIAAATTRNACEVFGLRCFNA